MKKSEIVSQISRKAILFQVGGFRPDDNLYSSWVGKVLVAEQGASWPTHSGKSMLPVCQLNLSALPFRPQPLEEIAMLTLFINPDWENADDFSCDDFLIRTYKNFDDLIPLQTPVEKFNVKPFQLKPIIIENDCPCFEDCPIDLPDKFIDEYENHFPNNAGIKIGGWPSLLQSEINWNEVNGSAFEFAFQIDSVPKAGLTWGDNGIIYFGINSKGDWEVNWQTL
ncbi:MAG: YwqG family protein [Flavobacterium sp.]|jgi:hypothetical protein|nr:YwqG family protein [Flavobacterium sp.]